MSWAGTQVCAVLLHLPLGEEEVSLGESWRGAAPLQRVLGGAVRHALHTEGEMD